MTISEREETLKEEARLFLSRARGLRGPHTEDLFARRVYIGPEDVHVENYPRRPLAVFNPGAVLEGEVVHLFPRLVFEYYSYASAIGHATLPLKDLLAGRIPKPLPVRILLYPTELFEAVRGCEDARAHRREEGYALFYTGVGKLGDARNTDSKEVFTAILSLAEFDEAFQLKRKAPIRIGLSGEETGLALYLPTKNATFLEGDHVLLRPSLSGLPDLCWRGRLDPKTLKAYDLRPVLAPEAFEYKVGWSTNALRLPDGTYLVAYHGILRHDLSYRHGFMRLSPEGRPLGLSHYLLAPQGLAECYGDRPLTLYGNGLLLHGEELVFVGGVGDYAIGVFTAPLEEVLKRVVPL